MFSFLFMMLSFRLGYICPTGLNKMGKKVTSLIINFLKLRVGGLNGRQVKHGKGTKHPQINK